MNEYKCKKVKEIMVDFLSGEFTGTDPRSKFLEKHLQTCSRCSREYDLLKGIFRESGSLNAEADAVMETIDWEENAREISLGISINQGRRRAWDFSPQVLNWKWVVPALVGFFILGVWLGFVLFYQTPRGLLPGEDLFTRGDNGDNRVIERLETTLTRREMQGYFLQTQLLLTDLMRQCDEQGAAAWSNSAGQQRIRALLNKNRYFNVDSTDPELLSTRRLLKKIEWLLYEMMEIMEIDDKTSCRQLQRLQDYIRKEKLLLKLRLVGKDISYNEV